MTITYCDGIGCNGSTKAALKLASFGLRVKELLGGLDWWMRDGPKAEQGAQSGTRLRLLVATAMRLAGVREQREPSGDELR